MPTAQTHHEGGHEGGHEGAIRAQPMPRLPSSEPVTQRHATSGAGILTTGMTTDEDTTTTPCPACEGRGRVRYYSIARDCVRSGTCAHCDGTGRRSVTALAAEMLAAADAAEDDDDDDGPLPWRAH